MLALFRRLLPAPAVALAMLLPAAVAAEPPPAPRPMNAAEIQLALHKLNVLGRVLYVAAHPDDENTGLLTYYANGAGFDAAYLSLTRGDGGQNLIGPELREALGVIRTEELLAARRLDGAQQFFTRANDFGFSKNADETLRIWDREKVLADIVWVIRRFRPDVVITRFDPTDGLTHGHHTASAILTLEAFRAAGDPARFPEQLRFAQPWQPRRLLWNTSRFFFTARNLPFDPAGLASLEVGGYQPLLGKSYGEIASESRSMHKSQGFGIGTERGARKEFFKSLDGEPMPANGGPFDGIDTTWARVPNAAGAAEKIRAVLAAYSPADPAASAPGLLELRRALLPLVAAGDPWASQKTAELDTLLAACLGLHLEAVTEKPSARPGEALALGVEAVNRSAVPVKLRSLRLPATGETIPVDAALPPNQVFVKKIAPRLPETLPFSQPYWLREPGTVGTYTVADQQLIGRPENPPAFPVEVTLGIGDQEITYALPARHRRVDPVEGETSQPLVIAPPVFVELPRPVFMFGDARPKTVEVRVVAGADAFDGELALEVPAGWRVEPPAVPVHLRGAESETTVGFTLTPPPDPGEGTLRAVLVSPTGERRAAFGRQRIRYPHIDLQTLIPPAEAKLVRADIQTRARIIGYLPGAGDAVPESLREIGVEVKILDDAEVKAADLARFDAVILGVRLFNVREDRLGVWLPELTAYAKNGGVVIVQYNTAPGPKPDQLPFPLHVSRERVTDETAAVRLLAPDHPALNFPNRITASDFDGWVQERGLYFPDTWDPAWTPLLSCHDPGEQPLDGGLLVARCERGYFVYTGLSWFRELPAGVPGAYRLFANLTSLGKQP